MRQDGETAAARRSGIDESQTHLHATARIMLKIKGKHKGFVKKLVLEAVGGQPCSR
jgi:hypothetical protein